MSINHVRHFYTQFIAPKSTIGKMPKTWVVNIIFCSVPFRFLFGYFFSALLVGFSWDFFIFNVEEWRRESFKKWTLISFKLQKITLFSLMNGMSCTYTARTRSHHCVPHSVCGGERVCVQFKYQCSMFEIWYAWRATANIKCNLFHWHFFLPYHFC